MRKIAFILILTILALSFASAVGTDTVNFGIVWRHNVNATTTISIRDYSGQSQLPNDTKNLEGITTRQSVCMIRYSSNAGGTCMLTYRATSLQTANHTSSVGYKLYFTYNDQVAVLEVGDDIGTTYPSDAYSVYHTFDIPYGSSTLQTFDVLVNAELPLAEHMLLETQYSSTVTIERVSV